MAKFFSDWKVHLLCLGFVVFAELIAPKVVGPFPVLGAKLGFTIFPMLFALAFGIVLAILKKIPRNFMDTASPYIGIATFWLISKLSATIGPNLRALANAGPALILQEFGNLFTIFFSMPLAIFAFKMGRQAIGAGFSISREPSLALISGKYGLNSPEGQGVMGAYIVGTVLGTIWFSLIASILIAFGFGPLSIAMGAGSGSASMMAAGLGPVIDQWPQMESQIRSFGATSNLITVATGLYFNLFLAIPIANWLYKKFNGEGHHRKALEKKAVKLNKSVAELIAEETGTGAAGGASSPGAKTALSEIWATRLRVLGFALIFTLIGNWINTIGGFSGIAHYFQNGVFKNPTKIVSFAGGLPAMFFMALPIIIGLLINDLICAKTKIRAPAILYISLVGIIMGIPGFPNAAAFVAESNKIGLLPMAVPILAYAGISIGKDLKGFKEQGVAIVCISLLALAGTFVGSAIIAEFILRIMGTA